MATPTPLLSKVAFGALLAYSPRGASPTSIRSRGVRTDLKSVRPQLVPRVTDVLVQAVAGGRLGAFFGEDVVLVPAPRSAPLESGWLWPANTLCQAIVAAGLAAEVRPCIRRRQPVPKSAFARSGERPSVQTHLDSMEVDLPDLLSARRVTVVDDVVTKGATLLACASLAKAAFPSSEVRAFAVLRTRGLPWIVQQPPLDQLDSVNVGQPVHGLVSGLAEMG